MTDGVNSFSLASAAFVPSFRDEAHRQLGATLKTKYKSGWNGSVVVTDYEILKDRNHVATSPEPVAVNGGTGMVTRRDGTGWNTFEAQAMYTPQSGDFGNGNHALTFGVHRNAYVLSSVVNDATDWRTTETTLNNRSVGETTVQALYAQDAWKISESLKLTAGLRYERFKTFDGQQTLTATNAACAAAAAADSTISCAPKPGSATNSLQTQTYGARTINSTSPKLSLAWTATDDMLLKASYGRGTRFPTVDELYNGTKTATSDGRSDPNLKPEQSDAIELSAEKFFDHHTLRVSVFHDDVSDAILRQSDITVTPTVTRVSNVDRVKTTGIEFVWQAESLFNVAGLSLDMNAALTRSKVDENSRDPATEGKYWLRVPKTRGSLLLTYRPTEQWMGSVGYRHQGRAYNDSQNLDVNPDVYGGVSSVNQVDLRVSYKPQPKLEFALGVDNAFDGRAYQSHPYPGRTMFFEMKASM